VLFTLAAKRRDESVSWWCRAVGLMLTNMSVLAEPERALCSTCVSFELRKGTCAALTDMAAITSPSEERLLLMALASRSASPVTPLSFVRSDPVALGARARVGADEMHTND